MFLTQAAEHDPDYQLPYRVRESVFTYLGRAYYEIGRDAEARRALEQAIARDKEDPLARLYLGLILARNGEPARGEKEIGAGLESIMKLSNMSRPTVCTVTTGIPPCAFAQRFGQLSPQGMA